MIPLAAKLVNVLLWINIVAQPFPNAFKFQKTACSGWCQRLGQRIDNHRNQGLPFFNGKRPNFLDNRFKCHRSILYTTSLTDPIVLDILCVLGVSVVKFFSLQFILRPPEMEDVCPIRGQIDVQPQVLQQVALPQVAIPIKGVGQVPIGLAHFRPAIFEFDMSLRAFAT